MEGWLTHVSHMHTITHWLAHTDRSRLMGCLQAAQSIHTWQDFPWKREGWGRERERWKDEEEVTMRLPVWMCRVSSWPLTLQQLQAGSAPCANVADLVLCVPLGAAGGCVAPTWTKTHELAWFSLATVEFFKLFLMTSPLKLWGFFWHAKRIKLNHGGVSHLPVCKMLSWRHKRFWFLEETLAFTELYCLNV